MIRRLSPIVILCSIAVDRSGWGQDVPGVISAGRPYLEFDRRIEELFRQFADERNVNRDAAADRIVSYGMPARAVLQSVRPRNAQLLAQPLIRRIEKDAAKKAPVFAAAWSRSSPGEVQIRDLRRPFYLLLVGGLTEKSWHVDIDHHSEIYLLEIVFLSETRRELEPESLPHRTVAPPAPMGKAKGMLTLPWRSEEFLSALQKHSAETLGDGRLILKSARAEATIVPIRFDSEDLR